MHALTKCALKIFYISIIIAFTIVTCVLFFMQVMRALLSFSQQSNAIRIIREGCARQILDGGVILAEDRLALNVASSQSVKKAGARFRGQLSRFWA